MLATLLPLFSEVVFTRSSRRGALPAATLASLARQLGGPADADRAVAADGAGACTRACGPRRGGRGDRLHLPAVRSRPRRRAAPQGVTLTQHARMLGFVALVVAVVILVFFALGYGLGRLLL